MSVAAKVTVGVAGGIAAYRAVELVRALQTAGFDPHVAMTASAQQFVAPLTFAAISGHNVHTTLWTGAEVPEGSSSIDHIAEAQTTACLVVAPATADILAKFAHGLADDFLTTLYLATPAPVVIAPAMNVAMWNHPAVQANVATLRARGNTIVEPDEGHLACGMQGAGRLAPLESIVSAVQAALAFTIDPATKYCQGAPSISASFTEMDGNPASLFSCRIAQRDMELETVLITAGGTREPIDAVRFIGNRSSGRMGYALAEEAIARGARAILVSANCALPVPAGAELIPVQTAAEMRSSVLGQLPRATLLLKAAAVADFAPASPAPGKLHRAGTLTLTLEPTPDIVAEAVAHRAPGTLIVAFAAEIPESGEDPVARARAKLLRKGADAIVLNDVSLPGLGFDSASNAGTFLTATDAIAIPPTSKRAMAARILDEALALRRLSPIPVEA
jgi:phosphopantothenoylcysteine decarboxylase/phosphopantothenate--cysteine ligase